MKTTIARLPIATVVALSIWGATWSYAQKIELKDGRVLEGRLNRISGVADRIDRPSAHAGEVPTRQEHRGLARR